MKRYMRENYGTLIRYSGYGVSGRKVNEIYKIFEYIYNSLIFTNNGGYDGKKERMDKINMTTSYHNNTILLELGKDVRKNDIDYTYVFGCRARNSIKLIGYFKNRDYENNLVQKEYEFDMNSLKDFIFDRANNYLKGTEKEDEWQINFKQKRKILEIEEEELE